MRSTDERQLVDLSAGNPEQVLDILASEKRGEDWILKVRIGDWQGERFVRWTRFGEEMVYGVPEDGGLPYDRLDLSPEEVERAFLAGRKCGGGGGGAGGGAGGGERTKSKGKAGKHKGG